MKYYIKSHTPGTSLPEEMLSLYIDAFPSDERRSWRSTNDISRFLSAHKEMNISLLYDGQNHFGGFIIYWYLTEDTIYIEHLATLPSLRGNGLGTMIIEHMTNTYGKHLILEVEPPTDTITQRRVNFYERNGLILHESLQYRQPPYSPDKQPLDLCIMTTPALSDEELNVRIIPNLYKIVYGA